MVRFGQFKFSLTRPMFSEYSINGYWFVLFLTLTLITYLAFEMFRHRRRLKQIKYRIHVNGTRGKSSVARLIAAGLRGGSLRTICKTTGTMARFIDIEGREQPVLRVGRTNIIEQVNMVKKASEYSPDALVIECMAVQPLLQSLCELKLVRATHGVLSNARADHLDVMGPTEYDVALALAGTVPVKGLFFTPEKKYLSVFKQAAEDRRTRLISIDKQAVDEVSDEEMQAFSYVEYKENVALSLKVCEACGVSRADALRGMWSATPDLGALVIRTIEYQQKKITFANGFAANDPLSTGQLWNKVIAMYPQVDETWALVNCRADRGDRSRQIAEAITQWPRVDKIIAIGSGTDLFLKQLDKSSNKFIRQGEGFNVSKILQVLVSDDSKKHILAIGVCNIAAIGFELLNYFLSEESAE